MIIDTHAHFDDKAFNEDREALLAGLPEAGIELAVNIGANMSTSAATVALTEKYPHIYGAVGVHPSDTAELTDEKLQQLSAWCKKDKIIAVGEIGLDYYWDTPEREIQKKWFRAQLKLAFDENLPVVIHSRDAAADTMNILKEEARGDYRGIMHCFSYSPEIAAEVVKMGFYLGIGGVVTFANAKKLVEVVAQIPLERIVLETDCPYLAPVPYRGKRNSSLYLPLVVDKIAEIKGISKEEVERVTTANARKVYNI